MFTLQFYFEKVCSIMHGEALSSKHFSLTNPEQNYYLLDTGSALLKGYITNVHRNTALGLKYLRDRRRLEKLESG